jgi:hypothetical protein
MPLIECPECKKPVSSEANACPFCGYPVAEKVGGREVGGPPENPSPERTLLAEVRPSCWAFFWYWFFFFLIIPPIVGLIRRNATVLRVYTDRITIEEGILAKSYQDYAPRDIRSIDVDQSFWGRLVDIGDITLSTAATAEGSEILRAMPDPHSLRELILAQRNV